MSRKVPHVNMTEGLKAAIDALPKAPIIANPCDLNEIRAKLSGLGGYFEDPAFFSDGEHIDHELKMVESVIALSTLYREHLLAGNRHDREAQAR